jgi:hypothetical protein
MMVLNGIAVCQAGGKVSLPCEYGGEVLRDSSGKIVRYTSDEMKARATYKQDVPKEIKQFDIQGTAIVDVLVGPDGRTLCAKSLVGHPIITKAVENALRNWRFSPATLGTKPIAYTGRLQFQLCNISCGDVGPLMSIVK